MWNKCGSQEMAVMIVQWQFRLINFVYPPPCFTRTQYQIHLNRHYSLNYHHSHFLISRHLWFHIFFYPSFWSHIHFFTAWLFCIFLQLHVTSFGALFLLVFFFTTRVTHKSCNCYWILWLFWFLFLYHTILVQSFKVINCYISFYCI